MGGKQIERVLAIQILALGLRIGRKLLVEHVPTYIVSDAIHGLTNRLVFAGCVRRLLAILCALVRRGRVFDGRREDSCLSRLSKRLNHSWQITEPVPLRFEHFVVQRTSDAEDVALDAERTRGARDGQRNLRRTIAIADREEDQMKYRRIERRVLAVLWWHRGSGGISRIRQVSQCGLRDHARQISWIFRASRRMARCNTPNLLLGPLQQLDQVLAHGNLLPCLVDARFQLQRVDLRRQTFPDKSLGTLSSSFLEPLESISLRKRLQQRSAPGLRL